MPVWTSDEFFAVVTLKSAAVLGVTWLLRLLLRRSSAAVRHLVWTAAFAALLALPFLSLTLPALHVPVTGSLLSRGLLFQTNALAGAQKPTGQSEKLPSTAPLPKARPWLPDWRISLTLIWAAGAAVSLAQMFIGWISMLRFRRRRNPFRMSGLASLTKLFEIEEVDLLEAPRGSMPMTYGLFRPAVFVPGDITEWNPERRRIVLLHELAHVRRSDGATHLLARTVLGLYWWNPLAWAAWREFLKERERAADDLVLNAGSAAPDYATHLLEIARSMQAPSALGWSALAMARRSQLEGRLLAILDSSRDRRAPRRAFLVAASLLAIGIVSPLAAVRAQDGTGQGTVSSQTATSVVSGLIKSGDIAREEEKYDQAKDLYGKALTALRSGTQAATVLIRLGTVELATKDFEQAISDFGRAVHADPEKISEARMWMAISEQRRNNLEAADALYQSALAAEEPDSAAAATIMELYVQLLQQQERPKEAATMRSQAAAIRKAQAALVLSTMQASSSEVYRAGANVSAPALLFKVEPAYTEEGRIAKYQGTTLLSVEVGGDGIARKINVIRALGFGLGEKAIEAISQWRFKPGTKDGQPVAVAATIEVNFQLK